jgi:hypothetical protein
LSLNGKNLVPVYYNFIFTAALAAAALETVVSFKNMSTV